MEIDDCDEDGESGDEIHHVWKVLSIKRFFESTRFIAPSEEEMEQTDDCAFEFRSTAGVDGRWGECFPDDILADIGCDEEGDSRSNAVSLLEHLIEEDDDHAGSDELQDQEDDDSPSEVGGTAVYSGCNIHDGLSECQDQCEYYLLAELKEAGDCIFERSGRVRDPI